MADLLVGLVAGLTLCGTCWAWFELRRDHRRLMLGLADLMESRTVHTKLIKDLQADNRQHAADIYDHNADLDTLEQRFGYGRYKRGA